MALAALIEDKGGKVLVNAAVSRILVANGRAHGVETSDGRRVRARQGVVSSAHVLTLPSMLGGDAPADIKAAIRAWQPGIALFAVHAALKKDIEYTVGGQYATSTSGGLGSPEGVLKQLNGCLTGHPELDDPWMLLVSSTVADPARAPGGTFKILTAAPGRLAAGRTWDDYGGEYTQHLVRLAGRHVRGLEQADVLAVVPETPASLARRNLHNIGGSCHGGEFVMANGEVIPGWPRYRTELDGLFLTGSTVHPGGSVSGWPGRNTAHAVLSASGIDPRAVMG